MRETHEWTAAELDCLDKYYALFGSAFVMRCFPNLTPNACRQMATRRNLADDLKELTPIQDAAEAAGVTVRAVELWLGTTGMDKHCWRWGRLILLPLPVLGLYLPGNKWPRRPAGWLGVKAAAAQLGITERRVQQLCRVGSLTSCTVRGVTYIDPHALPSPRPVTPPPNHVALQVLAQVTGVDRKTLSRAKLSAVTIKRPAGRPADYVHEDAARRFLSARGHREDVVELYLRRAVAADVAQVKAKPPR